MEYLAIQSSLKSSFRAVLKEFSNGKSCNSEQFQSSLKSSLKSSFRAVSEQFQSSFKAVF